MKHVAQGLRTVLVVVILHKIQHSSYLVWYAFKTSAALKATLRSKPMMTAGIYWLCEYFAIADVQRRVRAGLYFGVERVSRSYHCTVSTQECNDESMTYATQIHYEELHPRFR